MFRRQEHDERRVISALISALGTWWCHSWAVGSDKEWKGKSGTESLGEVLHYVGILQCSAISSRTHTRLVQDLEGKELRSLWSQAPSWISVKTCDGNVEHLTGFICNWNITLQMWCHFGIFIYYMFAWLKIIKTKNKKYDPLPNIIRGWEVKCTGGSSAVLIHIKQAK